MKSIKVGFLGTHGVGKTTAVFDLAGALKKENKSVFTVINTARSCPLEINENATINAQFWIFGELLKKEQESHDEVTICDRTLLDVFAYLYRISNYVGNELRPFVKGYMCTYDVIFYMYPTEGYLREDGKRSVNKEFQKEIKDIIDIELEEMEIDVVENSDQEERVSIVMELCNDSQKEEV